MISGFWGAALGWVGGWAVWGVSSPAPWIGAAAGAFIGAKGASVLP